MVGDNQSRQYNRRGILKGVSASTIVGMSGLASAKPGGNGNHTPDPTAVIELEHAREALERFGSPLLRRYASRERDVPGSIESIGLTYNQQGRFPRDESPGRGFISVFKNKQDETEPIITVSFGKAGRVTLYIRPELEEGYIRLKKPSGNKIIKYRPQRGIETISTSGCSTAQECGSLCDCKDRINVAYYWDKTYECCDNCSPYNCDNCTIINKDCGDDCIDENFNCG